jgi:hypothetical protein
MQRLKGKHKMQMAKKQPVEEDDEYGHIRPLPMTFSCQALPELVRGTNWNNQKLEA